MLDLFGTAIVVEVPSTTTVGPDLVVFEDDDLLNVWQRYTTGHDVWPSVCQPKMFDPKDRKTVDVDSLDLAGACLPNAI